MSVASTKAFYAQVAAGVLLACAIAEAIGCGSDQRAPRAAGRRCASCPTRMRTVLTLQPEIADAARRLAPSRRYWAVVGSGPNSVAAEEIRIKLSELCYKSIACDVTEDKKHIDLSSEPLILVCAAGLIGSTADDVAKEVAIYRAHKAAPDRHRHRGRGALPRRARGDHRARRSSRRWPSCCRRWSATCSATRRRWPSTPWPARCGRPARPSRRRSATGAPEGDELLGRLRETSAPVAQRFLDGLRSGAYDGNLEAVTAVGLASLLRYATGDAPLESYQLEYGKVGTPAVWSTTSPPRSPGASRS